MPGQSIRMPSQAYHRSTHSHAGTHRPLPFSLLLIAVAMSMMIYGFLPPDRVRAQSAIPTAPAHTIVVIGEGTMRVEPDIAHVTIGVEIVDRSIQTATGNAREIVQQILDRLETEGVAAADIQTSGYSVNVEHNLPIAPSASNATDEPPSAGEDANSETEDVMPLQYRVVNQVDVVVRELDTLGTLLDAAVEAVANHIYGIRFSRRPALESTARERAIADAQAKAEELAQLAGIQLGNIVGISEVAGNWGFPIPAAFGMAASPVPVAPGEVELTMQLQVTYAIEGVGERASGPAESRSSGTSSASITATRAVTTTATVSSSDDITEVVTIHGGDEATLREFLRHSLTPAYPGATGNRTIVYIGALPPELPFTLDLPTGINIVGSVVTLQATRQTSGVLNTTSDNMQLLFSQEPEAGTTASTTISNFRRQLEAQGYTPVATSPRQEVFQAQAQGYIPLCSPDGEHAVLVNGRDLPDGTGTLHVHINPAASFGGQCGVPSSTAPSEFDTIMPTLTAPPNVTTYSSGSGSTGDSIEASIGFAGDTTIAALTDHYYPQLLEQGWQQLGSSQTADMAWSGWSTSGRNTDNDNTYIATFYIVREAGDTDRFEARLRVKRE